MSCFDTSNVLGGGWEIERGMLVLKVIGDKGRGDGGEGLLNGEYRGQGCRKSSRSKGSLAKSHESTHLGIDISYLLLIMVIGGSFVSLHGHF